MVSTSANTASVSVTINGRGLRNAITHPMSVAAVPVINSVSPATGGVAGMDHIVTLIGTGFTGTIATTGVKFGATNAVSWNGVGDNVLYVIPPAHVSGGVNIVVQNATGPSVSTATYTYS